MVSVIGARWVSLRERSILVPPLVHRCS
jgi:hypothetical protein